MTLPWSRQFQNTSNQPSVMDNTMRVDGIPTVEANTAQTANNTANGFSRLASGIASGNMLMAQAVMKLVKIALKVNQPPTVTIVAPLGKTGGEIGPVISSPNTVGSVGNISGMAGVNVVGTMRTT